MILTHYVDFSIANYPSNIKELQPISDLSIVQ